MSTTSVSSPYPIFTNADGSPLSDGYIYIGEVNLSPEAYPKTAYWDEALTITASQPIRTINGYPSRNGSPARIYVDENYSIVVKNKIKSTVYSSLSTTDLFSLSNYSFETGKVVGSVTDFIGLTSLTNGNAIFVTDPNHGGPFVYDTSILKTAHNGVDIFDTDINMTAWTYTSANPGFGVLRRITSYITVEMAGAIGGGVADDTAALQAAFSASGSENLEVTSRGVDYLTSSTISITARASKIRMHPNSSILSSVSAGNYAVECVDGLFQNVEVYIENTDISGNGLRIANGATVGTDNSLYGKFKGRCQNLAGKAVAKPVIGSGSVGVLFDAVPTGSGDSNYFHVLEDSFRIRGYDTCMRLADSANANRIMNPQIEDYWYGIDVDSDENFIQGGFAHFSAGSDASNLSEAFHIRANRTFNNIKGMVIEPGNFGSAGVIEVGANSNEIDVIDNSAYGWNNLGSDNGAIDGVKSFRYQYVGLVENTYVSCSYVTMATNTRRVNLDVTYDSYNAATAGRSSGTATVSISRDGAGVIGVKILKSTLSTDSAGIAVLKGFEIIGNNVFFVFQCTNNGGATSATLNVDSTVTRTGIKVVRFQAATTAPGVGIVSSVNNSADIKALTVNGSSGNAGDPMSGLISVAPTAINYPSIAAGGFASATRTVTGAALGDIVRVSSSVNLTDGLFLYGKVTAADTVIIQCYNSTAGAIDPANFIPRIVIEQY